MRRLARLAFTCCAALSLLSSAALIVAWVSSYFVFPMVTWGVVRMGPGDRAVTVCECEFGVLGGMFAVHYTFETTVRADAAAAREYFAMAWVSRPRKFEAGPPVPAPTVGPSGGTDFWLGSYADLGRGAADERILFVHCGVLALAAAVPPAAWFLRRRRRRRTARHRLEAGLCTACGYDLRASPGGCPECGAANVRSANP
jgi:hypothetical protein